MTPPYGDVVAEYVAFLNMEPDELFATIPPLGGPATAAGIAANAVMAGCRKEYLPVILCA